MSNAMRSGKRTLAAVAAGALGAGLISFVAAPSASAGPAASIAWDYPSLTIVATAANVTNGIDNAQTIPLSILDAAGDPVASADDTANRSVQITIAPPVTADYDDSVVVAIGSGAAGLNVNSANAAQLASTKVQVGSGLTGNNAGWNGLLGVDGAGTYTITARLINTNNGAVLSTATLPVNVAAVAAAPAANVSFLNGSSNVISNIGVDADDSIAAQTVALTNSTGGPYVINDDSVSFSSATLTLGTFTNPDAGGTLPGVYTFTPSSGSSTGAAGTKTMTGAVIGATSTTIVGTGNLTYNVGSVDPAAASTITLTTTPSFDATPGTDDTWQVPPGTAKLDFTFNLTNSAATGTVAWNASSNATGGAVTPAGGAANVVVDSGTISVAPNAKASAQGKIVQVTLGAANVTNRKTIWVVFAAPAATVDTTPGIGKISTATDIPGTITDQYGAALPGTWAIRLLNGAGQSCTASITPIATTTASATGAFTVTIPAANTPSAAGNASYTVCASNGFTSAGANSTVTFTATGGVTSLTAAGYLASSTLATSLPVVQVPGTGIVNVGTLTSVQQTAATTLTAATLATAGTAFQLQATVTPSTAVTFSGTEGVMFTTQSAGSLSYSAGSSTKTVVATAGAGTSGTSTVYVYSTKPGVQVVTITAGTTTTTFSFKAGVARGTIRQIEAIPASITLKPNEFKGAQVKATDIFGNAVPDDSSITAALAGGGTIAPVAGSTLTTGVDGIVTVYYTAPLGDGKGRLLWTAGTYVSGAIPGAPAAVYQAATEIDVTSSGPDSKSIVIVGERATVSGKPGIRVEGETKGFDVGSKMVPSIRFPGESSYTAGTARPTTSALGDFTWQRKTGKKTYVFFTNEAGDVKSNRVIIPAN